MEKKQRPPAAVFGHKTVKLSLACACVKVCVTRVVNHLLKITSAHSSGLRRAADIEI